MHKSHFPSDRQSHTDFDIAVFSVKTVSLSRCRGRKPCTLLDAARHNLRGIKAERGAINSIDPRRSGENVILRGPSQADEVQNMSKALLAEIAGLRLKRDHVQAIEFMFSTPVDFPGFRRYLERCSEWIDTTLGLPILSAVIHLDQNQPHMHVLLLPVKDGRHVGGGPIKRGCLLRLRDKFFMEVSGPAGFQRSNPKLRGTMKKLASQEIITEAINRGLRESNGVFWPILEDAIWSDPLPLVRRLGIDVEALRRRMLASER